MAGQWWSSNEEYRFLQSIVVMCVCSAVLLFDTVMHALKRWVVRHDHDGDLSQALDVAAFFEKLFNRASSELMVLGFLAFSIWCVARSSGFDSIVAQLPGADDCVGAYGRRLASPAPCRRQLAGEGAAAGGGDGEGTPYGRDPFNYPPTGSDLLHVVEDVHIQIFVSMLAYFCVMAGGITFIKHKCALFLWWEEELGAYQLFPTDANRAGWWRLIFPLSDVKDFWKVKGYFVRWAQSGALRHVEERRLKALHESTTPRGPHGALRRRLRWARPSKRTAAADPDTDPKASCASKPGAEGPAAAGPAVAAPMGTVVRTKTVTIQTDDAQRPIVHVPRGVPLPAGGAAALHGAEIPVPRTATRRRESVGGGSGSHGGGVPSVDVRITDRFHFADYLTLCFAEQLDELVTFRPITWILVVVLAAVEAACLYLGVREVAVELAFAFATVVCISAMWVLSKKVCRDVIRAAESGRIDSVSARGGRGSFWVHVTQTYHVEVHFLRGLQALTWRNLFTVCTVFLGPQLRSWLADAGTFRANNGPTRAALLGVTIVYAAAMPLIAFDWGLAMFLPPHIDEKNTIVAEQVTWRQTHPVESFKAPWERDLTEP